MSVLTNHLVISVTLLFFSSQCQWCYASSLLSSNVIIVGAGPSGIAAATRLLENNITNIIILEAENRIGGRIYSVAFGGTIIDLGAQWCHGENNNVVYQMVKNLDLLKPDEFLLGLYHSSRKQIDKGFEDELVEVFDGLFYENNEDNEISLGDYITKSYNKIIKTKYGDDLSKLQIADEYLKTLLKTYSSLEGAFSLFNVSAKQDYVECEGSQVLSWKGRGYKTILDILMKKYPKSLTEELPIDDKIILNKEVIEIIWDDNNNNYATIKCKDGSSYVTENIIFTPSLGVLKNNYNSMFTPALPEEKVKVIKTLGFNAVVKVFLHFPTKWWPDENSTVFTFVWSDEDKKLSIEEFSKGPVENGNSWLFDLTQLYSFDEKNPNLVTAWFCGEFVPQIELLSDDLIIDGITFVLNKFLGHEFQNISRPDSIIRHNWYSNPHFRGTYSFQTVESHQFEQPPEVILSKPLTSSNGKQKLLFAGEATHPTYYSTVHGAIETGFREAQRIIDSYK